MPILFLIRSMIPQYIPAAFASCFLLLAPWSESRNTRTLWNEALRVIQYMLHFVSVQMICWKLCVQIVSSRQVEQHLGIGT